MIFFTRLGKGFLVGDVLCVGVARLRHRASESPQYKLNLHIKQYFYYHLAAAKVVYPINKNVYDDEFWFFQLLLSL
jgi:hypothetical protein